MKRLFSFLLILCLLCALLPALPARAAAAGDAWDGTVDISWYDPDKTEFYLSTPAQLAGLAALVNGMTDPTCPKVIGDAACIQSIRVDDYTLVGAGGGNVSDTVYTSAVDFAYKTVYLTEDMDMGGRYDAATASWSGPNWTPVAGKFPMKPEEVAGDCLTLDTRFNRSGYHVVCADNVSSHSFHREKLAGRNFLQCGSMENKVRTVHDVAYRVKIANIAHIKLNLATIIRILRL